MPKRYWRIFLYHDENDNSPIVEYIFEGNDDTKISLLIHVVQRLARVGLILIDTQMCKRLDKLIFELRKDRHRILFAEHEDGFILLSAFLKETQKTPPKEIRLARRRLREFHEHPRYQEMDPKFML